LEKIFLPDGSEGKVIHGTVESFTNSQVTLVDKTVISFDYLVIASGAMYDSPWKIQCESKDAGLKLLKDCSEKIKNSSDVVIIGGGPTGIETAAEIKSTCTF
jgi:NADH dehydrogenase FAD-containing subunit